MADRDTGVNPTADELAAARAVNDASGEAAAEPTDATIQHQPEPAAEEQPGGGAARTPTAREIAIQAAIERRRRQIEQELAANGKEPPQEGEAHLDAEAGGQPTGVASEPSSEPEPEPEATKASKRKERVAKPDDDDPIIELKVNGRTVKLPQSEVTRWAQKGLAASETFFQAAAEMRKSAQMPLHSQPQAQQVSSPTPTPEQSAAAVGDGQGPATDSSGQSPAKAEEQAVALRARAEELAKALQYGSESEAAAAIEQILSAAKAQNVAPPSPQEILRIVDDYFVQKQVEVAYQQALDRVQSEFPDVLQHPPLARLASELVHEERAKDLIEAGVDENEVRNALLSTEGRQTILLAHHNLRRQGKVSRDDYGIFNAALSQVRSDYLKRPAQTSTAAATDQTRLARKERLPQSPAPATARTAAPAAPRPLSRSEIISRMRRARGLPVLQ